MKSIVLLSGGIDSATLANYVARELGEEVYGIFYRYGQPFCQQEFECAINVITELKKDGYTAYLIPWTLDDMCYNAEIFNPTRNLTFIANAAHYAVLYGFHKIYAGFIDPEKQVQYTDTSPKFTKKMNALLKEFDVEFVAPFQNWTKLDVYLKSREYGIDLDKTWSCNFPDKDGNICGKCGNCKFREAVVTPERVWVDGGFKITDKFKEAYMKEKIWEARLLINNECNLSCKHCFYGFEESTGKDLSTEEWIKVMTDCYTSGIRKFHFSGKEPIIDDKIFALCEYVNYFLPGAKYDVVSNGTTVDKYLDEIKKAGFERFCISIDDFDTPSYRFFNNEDVIKKLIDNKVPVTAFIAISKSNMNNLMNTFTRLKELGVKEIFTEPLHYNGNAKGITDNFLTYEDFYKVFKDMWKFTEENKDMYVATVIKSSYLEDLMWNKTDDHDFINLLEYVIETDIITPTDNFEINLDLFCERYLRQVTITSDGYMIGCGTEVSCQDYAERSSGNVRDKSIAELISIGKSNSLSGIEEKLKCAEENGCNICAGECRHTRYCYKNGRTM